MRYEVFDSMQEGSYARKDGESEQEYMERVLQAVYESQGETKKFNDMMAPTLISCSAKDTELTAGFRVMGWAANSAGSLHGGVLAAFIDTACGTLTRFCLESSEAVTTNLNINYMRSAEIGDTVTVTASMDKCGRKLRFLHARAFNGQGKLMAAATAQFM